MQDQGIILGYYNYVSISSTQMHTTKFLIRTRGPARKHRERVLEWGEQHPRITLVREMFGSWDYELTAELDRSGDALDLREQILTLFQGPEPDVSIISLLRHFHRALLPLE